MYYEVIIYAHNQKPHLDIEKEIQTMKNGRLTYTVRYGDGRIRDLVFLYYKADKSFLKTLTMTSAKRLRYPDLTVYPAFPIAIIQKNLKYHMLIEREIQEKKYGQSTFSVILKDGVAI